MKKRGFDKPLAIMVEDLDWLYENTPLTEEQLNFLSEYDKPYTVITDCARISLLLAFDGTDSNYQNHAQYERIAFRVAHTNAQKKLIKNHGPVFLTSANLSGKKENYTVSDLKEDFARYIDKIKVVDNRNLDESIKPSDIFSFEGETLKLNYLRKSD